MYCIFILHFTSQVNISIKNVEVLFNNLTEIVGMATEHADQNTDNIQTISTVIVKTASLLNESLAEGNVESEVIEMVSCSGLSSCSVQV